MGNVKQVHACREMKDENLLRFFNGDPPFDFLFDNIGGFVELVCANVKIRVSYCSFCGAKLEAEPIMDEVMV